LFQQKKERKKERKKKKEGKRAKAMTGKKEQKSLEVMGLTL